MVNDLVTIEDDRYEYGLVTNGAQRAGKHLFQIFAANYGTPDDESADNGTTLAAEALLTAGSGSNNHDGATVYGENVAFYAGLQRQSGSTGTAARIGDI